MFFFIKNLLIKKISSLKKEMVIWIINIMTEILLIFFFIILFIIILFVGSILLSFILSYYFNNYIFGFGLVVLIYFFILFFTFFVFKNIIRFFIKNSLQKMFDRYN